MQQVLESYIPQSPIYLDYLATSPVDPRVSDEIVTYMRTHWGNPSSSHFFGKEPKAAVGRARQQVADLLCCDASNIIFTSGGSESNSLAIFGGLKTIKEKSPELDHIITSEIEHSAVYNAFNELEKNGYRVTVLPVDKTGMVSVDDLKSAIEPNTALVSIMFANNVVGTIQPIKEIAKICQENSIIFHSDAAQAVGKLPINVIELGMDMLSVAGHKFYGPKGVGALYCRGSFRPKPIIHGTGQEGGIRSGTSNVPGVVGLGKAAELIRLDFEAGHHEEIKQMRDNLESKLKQRFPNAVVNGNTEHRLPTMFSIGIPTIRGYELLISLQDKVCFSTSQACNTGTPCRTLAAMGISTEYNTGTIRISLGRFTTQQQIDSALELLTEGITNLSKTD